MELHEFYRLKEQLNDQQFENYACGFSELGLLLDYENNQGQRSQFKVIHIKPSPLSGCFEADCYSYYRADEIFERYGIDDEDAAVTSHRTFKIANIISAKIV